MSDDQLLEELEAQGLVMGQWLKTLHEDLLEIKALLRQLIHKESTGYVEVTTFTEKDKKGPIMKLYEDTDEAVLEAQYNKAEKFLKTKKKMIDVDP